MSFVFFSYALNIAFFFLEYNLCDNGGGSFAVYHLPKSRQTVPPTAPFFSSPPYLALFSSLLFFFRAP